MLRQYKQIKKHFWRKTVIYFTVLTMLIQPGMIQQVMAHEHSKKQHLYLIEARARAVRTYVDPALPLARQQQLLSHKQLNSCKQALVKVKASKNTRSLIKDMEVLQRKIKNTHLGLQVELMDMRAKLFENDMPQEILERHDEFCEAIENCYRQFDRLLTVVQQNQDDSVILEGALEDVVEFVQPKSKRKPARNSFNRPKPYLPRHSKTFNTRQPAGPPYFQWPWLLAATGDVISTILTRIAQIDEASGPPDANDLLHNTIEINFDPNDSSDPIVAKAVELNNNPVEIFEYIRNELAYEPYFGSVKGAKRTLEEEAGNDTDLASLTMALLRASGIPCRYVFGTIELSAQDAADWTGVSDPGQVVQLFQANGIPLDVDYAGGEVETIRIDHVWVKAYVDNFPYRGTVKEDSYDGSSDGDAWLDLDPSFKQHTFTGDRGIENTTGIDIDPDTLLTNSLVDATVVEDGSENYVFGINEDLIGEQLLLLAEPIRNYLATRGLTTETVFRQRQVSEERYGMLPVTDLYKICARGCNFSTLPDELRYQLTVTLKNPDGTQALSVTRTLPELAGKKLTLLYEPANANYAKVLTEPNIIDEPNSFPVFLMLLKPKLRLDGQTVAEADDDEEMVGMSQLQNLEMTFTTPDGTTEEIIHHITAGGVHSLVLDSQQIIGGDLTKHYNSLNATAQDFDANDILSPDDTIGDVLHGIGLSYFHQMDRFNQITAGSLEVAITRQPSVVRVAWDLDTIEPYPDSNLPMYANSNRVRIVVGRDVHVPVAIEDQRSSQDNSLIPENQFLFTSALTSSALEHNALMQVFTGKQAASVARIIKIANDPNNDPNNPIYTITTFEDANNLTADGNSLAALPTDVKEYIKDAANAGYEITIPKTAIQIADCNYVGYIARDTETSESDFVLYNVELDKIAGGELKNGSLTPAQLIASSDPISDPNGYAALEDIVGSAAAWLKVTEDATTNAGLSYLPAIINIDRWFQTRTELDPVTTVASVLAVTNPITRLSVQSAILNVVAGSGSNGTIRDSYTNWVSVDANEFIIHADVTRNTQWQANIYRYGESTPHIAQVDGNEPNLVAVFTFAEPNDGYYRYVLTAGLDESKATPVEGTFHVDLTEPNAVITEANAPGPNTLGALIIRGTASDEYFTSYQLSVSQYGNEPNVVYASSNPVDNGVLCTISTLDFNDGDANVILKVWDIAGNVKEDVKSATISNPDLTAPDVNLSAVWDGNDIDPNTRVDGTINVSVTPIDPNERIKRIELWWCDQHGQNCQLIAEETDPNDFPIDVNSTNPWTYKVNTYLFENGPCRLTVYTWDMFGNMDTDSVDFFNNSTISNFKVDPSVATPLNYNLTISASLTQDVNWVLTFQGPTPIDDVNGSGRTVSSVINAKAENLNDGIYIVDVNIGAHDANTTFRVALKPPVAEISNITNDVYEEGSKDLAIDPLPIISEGLFELEGTAYHPHTQDNVEYKIELFEPQIGDYDPNYWKELYDIYYDYFVKIITPGEPNTSGWSPTRVINGPLGTLDLTGVENGTYQMLLTVRYNGSEAYDNVAFVLDCPLKIGNVRFTQEDLVVPVGGMPLRVTRTYDSFNKTVDGDFGYGWSYTIANMNIELNEERVTCESDMAPDADIRWSSNYDRNVTLTLPDGRTTTFVFYLKWHSGNLYEGEMGYWSAEYASPPGVTATLTTENREIIDSAGFWNSIWGTTGAIAYRDFYDFSGLVLTTEDGVQYHIERQDHGYNLYWDPWGGNPFWTQPYGDPELSHITTPSGETIHFNSNTIVHKDAEGTTTKTIKIEYSGNNIVAIKAPSEGDGDPNTIEYVYDSNDNLIEVHRLVDKDASDYNDMYDTTCYYYDDDTHDPCDHFVTDINDPRGLTPIRYLYDASGRLTGTIDAKGNTINITHDITGKTETIEDRLGYPTIYEYDERGNVISVTNAQGDTTSYQYTDSANPDKATAITDPLGNTTYYEYDDSGRTTRVDDPVGNVTTYYYDDNGNLEAMVQYVPDPENTSVLKEISRTTNEYNVAYPGRNLLEKTSDALGNSTVYEYDSKNRMTRIIKEDPNGFLLEAVTTNTYDDDSNFPSSPNSTTDAAGFTRYFEYDENGNQTKSWYHWVDPNDSNNYCNVYSITEYDAMDRTIRTIREVNDVNGIATSTVVLSKTEYNLIGKPDIVINEHGVLTAYEYDELGNLVETKVYDSNEAYTADANDIRTITEALYDVEGRAIVTTDPHDPCGPNVNGTETYYDALGRVKETRRWENVVIPVVDVVVNSKTVGRTNTLDDNGDPNWSHGDLLTKTVTEYDIAGRVFRTKVLDENGQRQTTEYEYDSAGRQIAVIDPLGNRTEYEYEGNRRTLVRDARAFEDIYSNRYKYETSFEYDKLGRLRYTNFSDGNYIHVGYDNLGRKSSETDQAGHTRWFEYDSAGRLTAVILPDVNDPNNSDTPAYPRYEYKYDTYGNLAAIWDDVKEDPETGSIDYTYKRVTTFTYNQLHKQTSRTLPNGKTETKLYDANGLIIKAIDFSGHAITFDYDDPNAAGLLHYQKFYDSNDLIGGEPNMTIHITYDELSRKTIVDVNDEGTDYVYQYWYDDEGRVYRTFSPQGYVNYEFSDSTGRRVSVYTPSGTADTEVDYYYDELGRLEQVVVDKRNSQDVDENIYYTYNAVGSLATVAYPNNVTTYTYNDLNRLTNVSITDGSDTEIVSYAYTLAADGQRTGITEIVDGNTTTIAWTYDALNRLIGETYDSYDDSNDFTHTYVYGLVGNRLEKRIDGEPNTTYVYNDADQLLSETTDGNTITYSYDDNGSVTYVAKDNDSNLAYYYDLRGRLSTVNVENGSTVDYKYSPAGIRVRATVDGNDIDYLVDQYNHTGYAQVFKEINKVTDANTIYALGHDVLAQATGADAPKYMLYDGHGSVRHLTNSAGNITGSFNYDAYGNAHGFTPSSASTNLLYAGEWHDSTAQQYYLRARWYSPATGRFNRIDPFAGSNHDPQSLHKYLYAHCNPINSIDPTGNFSLTEVMVSMAINSLIMNIGMPIIQPAGRFIAKGFLGKSWSNFFNSDSWQQAASIFGISGAKPIKFGLSVTGAFEVLIGWDSSDYAIYAAGGLSTPKSYSLSAYIGCVFNVKNSSNYNGHFFHMTLSLKMLPTKWQEKVMNLIAIAATKTTSPSVQQAISQVANKSISVMPLVNKILGDKTLNITLFGSPLDTKPYGFNIGIGKAYGGTAKSSISFGWQYYAQIYPWREVDF